MSICFSGYGISVFARSGDSKSELGQIKKLTQLRFAAVRALDGPRAGASARTKPEPVEFGRLALKAVAPCCLARIGRGFVSCGFVWVHYWFFLGVSILVYLVSICFSIYCNSSSSSSNYNNNTILFIVMVNMLLLLLLLSL